MSCRSGPWSAWWTAPCSAATPTTPSTAASPSFSRSTIESHKKIWSIVRQQQNWQKILQCMSIAYRQKLTSPKWNRFLGMKLRWKDKIRLNNVIWRCWHMQFIKVIIICHQHRHQHHHQHRLFHCKYYHQHDDPRDTESLCARLPTLWRLTTTTRLRLEPSWRLVRDSMGI